MKITTLVIVFACMGAGLTLRAQSNDRADLALQAAIKLELVDGNLKQAIAAYETLVRNSNRAVAAQALLRMGECQEKLGDKAARQAYEQLVKEFAEQKDAVAAATARLAALGGGTKTGLSYRQVWAGPKVELSGTISPDGRSVSYVDSDTGDLALHDLLLNTDRRLTDKGPRPQNTDFAEESAISRDGRQIAYSWFNARTARYDLRIASIPATGLVQPRKLLDDENILWIAPYAWTPDGKSIAVQYSRSDRRTTQIALVSTQDGTVRILKTSLPPASDARKLSVSPDGKYLGIDQAIDGNNRDIFVIDLEQNREIPVAAAPSQETMLGWSPDGTRLLFASDRRGSMDLWSIAMAGGQPHGVPELLRPNVAASSSGVTSSGALFLGLHTSNEDVTVASVDPATGRLVSGPTQPVQTFVGSNMQPDWSPDGKSLAYLSRRNVAGEVVLAIRTLDTGRIRELHPKLAALNYPRWSPDGTSFICQGFDREQRQGIFRINAETGETSPVVTSAEGGPQLSRPRWSSDGRRIFYLERAPGRDYTLVERELATGSRRQVTPRTFNSSPYVSPDGRFIATRVDGGPNTWTALQIVDVATGQSRELIRIAAPGVIGDSLSWTPDSRNVVIRRAGEGRRHPEIALVPLSGAQPRTLPIDAVGQVETIRVHPDGRQIAYVSGERKSELWVLEHFLPTASAK